MGIRQRNVIISLVFLMIREENKREHLKIRHNLWEKNLVPQQKLLDKQIIPSLVRLSAHLIKESNVYQKFNLHLSVFTLLSNLSFDPVMYFQLL